MLASERCDAHRDPPSHPCGTNGVESYTAVVKSAATEERSSIVNAERMHAVARKLREDLQETDLAGLLQRLSEAMTNMVNAPQEPSYQQNVSTLRAEIGTALRDSMVNTMSPVELQVLDEWGVSHLLGGALLEQIENAFDANQCTIQTALEQVSSFVQPVQGLESQLDQLVGALRGLRIGAEELQPGEFEIDVLVPRAVVRDELGELGTELTELEKILLPFLELVTGSRPGITVRSVGSSDFTLYLAAAPGVAVAIAKAVDEILKVYERIQNIRKTKAEIEALQLGDGADETIEQSVGPLEAYANSAMQGGTTEIARAIVEEFKSERLPEGREFQLEIEVRRSLLKVAERIDDGYNIAVRVGELPPAEEEGEETEDGDSAEAAARRELTEQVRAVEERTSRSRSLMNLTGSPILSLEIPSEDEDGATGG